MDPKESSDKSVKDQLQKKLQDFDAKEKVDQVRHFAETNTLDAAAYVVLLIGLIMALIWPHWGMAIIGVVTGFYFAEPVFDLMKRVPHLLEELGVFRCFVLGGASVALFFCSPTFFIGLCGMAAAKVMLLSSNAPKQQEGAEDKGE